jgi:hypothetical protein
MDSSNQSSGSTALSYLGIRNLVLAVFGYFVARVVYQIVYYRYFHPLSKFPGPFWGSVTRLWIAWVLDILEPYILHGNYKLTVMYRYHNLKEDEPMVCMELHKKYG